MVISKSPYDLGGMTTDRKWDFSCMNLRGGVNKHFVPIDIKLGTLVSFLVNPTDKNIKNPIGRILIKPYLELDNKDEVLYGIEHNKVKYGKDNPEYVKTLVNVLDKAQEEKTGVFRLDEKLYADAGKQFKSSNSKDVPPERILEYFKIKNYTINEDGTVDVNGDVDLSDKGLIEIPIKFGEVKGNFDVSHNKLLSLKNCPSEVGGEFKCSYNRQLSSLKWGPKRAKDYFCNRCDLNSLDGAPTEYVRLFILKNNSNITSLKKSPEKVGIIDCSGCNLTSLEGAPKSANSFYCSNQINKHEFTEEDVKTVCDVSGFIITK
jgi:hypothetical protein